MAFIEKKWVWKDRERGLIMEKQCTANGVWRVECDRDQHRGGVKLLTEGREREEERGVRLLFCLFLGTWL